MKKVKMHKKLVADAAIVEKVIILVIACDININTLSQHYYMHVRDVIKVRKKANIRNRFNQVPHLLKDTVWESDKYPRKHHIPESQEVSPFPAGVHKATLHRQEDNMAKTNTKKDPQKKCRLGTVSKKLTGGPKIVKSTMLIDTEISFPHMGFLHTASTTLHRLSSLPIVQTRHVHGIMILHTFKRPFRRIWRREAIFSHCYIFD